MLTFASLIDAEHVPAGIVRKLQRARLSHRAVSVQLGLANRIAAPAHSVSVLPWMEDQQEIFLQGVADAYPQVQGLSVHGRANPAPRAPKSGPGLSATRPRSRKTAAGSTPSRLATSAAAPPRQQ